jgi:predicted anti-sigma-YlaC factor YlaD
MTTTGVCQQVRLDLGVYLVGAIGTADRGAVDAHLACCAACRDQLAELAGLPGLLRRVTADDADSPVLYHNDGYSAGYESSADLSLHLLLRHAARLRRQRMWARVVAAACAGLIAGAGAVAASGRYLIVPYRTRRARMGQRSGDTAR